MMQENIRSPGGQPGNQNARTHGFYSKRLTQEQLESFQSAKDLKSLDDEIAILRLKIDSILANDPQNYRVLMQALSLLARLLQARILIDKNNPRKESKAIEVLREMYASVIGPPENVSRHGQLYRLLKNDPSSDSPPENEESRF
ncbi:MAG: hypothetical protein V1767_09420 [Chloroflexota bacterium]